jgi:hypothetical protein
MKRIMRLSNRKILDVLPEWIVFRCPFCRRCFDDDDDDNFLSHNIRVRNHENMV